MRTLIRGAARKLHSRREAEILMEHVTGLSRSEIYAAPDFELVAVQARLFQRLVARRVVSEPLQYLTGTQSFRRVELMVGPGVLVPRPETEVVVERALALIEPIKGPRVLDIGTGCGAIALSIASERADARVCATDISAEALKWAEANVRALQSDRVELLRGDLFEAVAPHMKFSFDLIVSNPPYLTDQQVLAGPADVRDHEPHLATIAGPTGLEVVSRLIEGAPQWLKPNGWIVLETWEGQAEDLSLLLVRSFQDLTVTRDLTGKIRVLEARKK